jgi:hypothetical protein
MVGSEDRQECVPQGRDFPGPEPLAQQSRQAQLQLLVAQHLLLQPVARCHQICRGQAVSRSISLAVLVSSQGARLRKWAAFLARDSS